MKNKTLCEESHNLTTSSTRSFRTSKSSYIIPKKYNPNLADDFYTQKKVNLTQELAKLKNLSARKIQKLFKTILYKKKLNRLKSLQSRSKKPLLFHFQVLSKILSKKLSSYWKILSTPITIKKSLTFDISSLKIKPELLEKIKSGEKGMISFIVDGLHNETQTFVKDMNDSHTFLKVFQEPQPEQEFQVKPFDNFEEMNFSRFDFMEQELPEYIQKDFNHSLWKKEKFSERLQQLQNKVLTLNEVMLKELDIRESLQDERDFLKSLIKKILNIKKFD